MSCDEKWTCEKWSCDELWWAVELWWVRCEKWSCDELVCDKLWWVVLWCVLRLPSQGSRGPSGAHARRSSSRRLCVLHLPRKRQPQPQRRPRAPQLLQEALCTAPAMRKAAAAPAAPTRRSFLRRLCVLHLPRKRQPRPQRRPRAPQLLQEALCTAPAMRKAAAAPAAPTRRSFLRRLCVLHLPRKRQPRPQRARRSSSRRLCVLRLPCERQPRPQRRPRAPQLLQEALCTASATPKAAAAPAAPTRAAAPPGGSVYCACHAKGSQEAICTVSESEWVWVWVSVCEWVSEGRGGGRRRAAGSKRKTRTPHSDVGNNVLHLENNHFGSWFSLTTFSVNDCSDRHFQETYSPILHQLWFVPLAAKLMEHIRGTLHWVVNNNWLEVSIPKNISQIGSSSQLLGKIKNVPNHQPDYVLSCALDPPWKRTGGYLKNGPPKKWFSH